jgi:hypothetical protein
MSEYDSDFANWIPLIYPQRTWDKGNYRNMVLHDITSNDTNGQPSIRRYDKGDDYNFAIINCPHLDSNIPTAPAYGVYIWYPPKPFWKIRWNDSLTILDLIV